jgi:Kef-type K+ transport system membrane component KefB
MASTLMRPRRILVAAGIAILMVGIVIAGVLAARALGPRISEKDATVIALHWAQGMNSSVTGYSVVSARYDPAPDRIYDDRGNLIVSESRSSCPILMFQGPGWLCPAKPAWILHLRAPAQGGFSLNDAYVVVNASDGSVSSASTQSIN